MGNRQRQSSAATWGRGQSIAPSKGFQRTCTCWGLASISEELSPSLDILPRPSPSPVRGYLKSSFGRNSRCRLATTRAWSQSLARGKSFHSICILMEFQRVCSAGLERLLGNPASPRIPGIMYQNRSFSDVWALRVDSSLGMVATGILKAFHMICMSEGFWFVGKAGRGSI